MDDVTNRTEIESRQPAPAREPRAEEPQLQPGLDYDQRDREPVPPRRRRRFAALRRHPFLALLAILLVVWAVVAGTLWYLNSLNYESTDDAFIDARTVSIGPQLSAAVASVPITDNERVAAGTVLVRLDRRPFQVAVDQANAQVEQAKAAITNLDAQIAAQEQNVEAAKTDVASAQAALTYAQQQNRRYQNLLQSGAATQQQAEQAASDLQQKQAAFDATQAKVKAAQKQVAVLQAQRRSAEAGIDLARAALEKAKLDLSYATITAPVAGHIANLSVAEGDYVQAGQSLMRLVPDEVWVTANFKESQISKMRPGQPVTIHVDAYPDRTFHGHVASIQAGSGAAFSLLPPENATGNFVKVVQRVPVKIVFDHRPDVLLGPGMSVEPTVKIR